MSLAPYPHMLRNLDLRVVDGLLVEVEVPLTDQLADRTPSPVLRRYVGRRYHVERVGPGAPCPYCGALEWQPCAASGSGST